jgi:hypothetical protein
MIRRPIGLTLLALALLPACAPQQAEDSTGATSGTSTGDGVGTGVTPTTGDGTPGTTTSATDGATTNPAATTGESTSSGEPTGETTTGEAGSTTTGDVSSTSGAATSSTGDTGSTTAGDETAAPVELVTKAWWVDGAESLQIRIIQADPGAGICRGVWLTVLDFGPNGFDPVEAPEPWDVRHVWVHQDLEDCYNPYQWFEKDPSWAPNATGTVIFYDVDDQGKPAKIDIDITGTAYKPAQPWVPAEDTLTATAVPVVVG